MALARSTDPRFVVEEFEPAYLRLYEEGRLEDRVAQALEALEDCRACPRCCDANRLEGETGVCNTGRHAVVSSAFPHFGEEDCLRGWRGSGTIFFAHCNLHCVFCQNWDISHEGNGQVRTAEEVAAEMLQLQALGCHNVNLVTPEHVVPQVIEALAVAIRHGLRIPVVYNTSAYDAPGSLALLDGLVDIYMPDFKFWRSDTAKALAKAKDYPACARDAIREMHRQVGPLRFGTDGVARRGVLVRHLVMPGQVEESAAIFEWLATELSPDTYVNIMGQYRPAHRVGTTTSTGVVRHAEIDRRPTRRELEAAYEAAARAGLWRFDARA